uniref:Uncharacterized protein n=1 Tax=Rhizophora mucronata TaxID=61149 RepID=A0A2P2LSL2_RHIMU
MKLAIGKSNNSIYTLCFSTDRCVMFGRKGENHLIDSRYSRFERPQLMHVCKRWDLKWQRLLALNHLMIRSCLTRSLAFLISPQGICFPMK